MVQLLQEIKIIELVPILEDIALDLGRIDPRNKILHVSEANQSAK